MMMNLKWSRSIIGGDEQKNERRAKEGKERSKAKQEVSDDEGALKVGQS